VQPDPRLRPRRVPELPTTVALDGYVLDIATVTRPGRWIAARREFRDVAGTAWLHFQCGAATSHGPYSQISTDWVRLVHGVEVVNEAVHRQTQISIADALEISPDARVGDTIDVHVDVRRKAVQDVLAHGGGLAGWHKGQWHEGQVFVAFEAEALHLDSVTPSHGTILAGEAVYPTDPRVPHELHASIAGFDLLFRSLTITPKGAIGTVTATLPGGIFSPDACQPARVDLGRVRIGPNCEVYAERPDQAYGPWLLADTGLEIEGTGFILDLSTTRSPGGLPPGWRGIQLIGGSATGGRIVPDPCNTGYLRGTYVYDAATVGASGFDGNLALAEPCTFEALNPRGLVVTLISGFLQVTDSVVSSGVLGPGRVSLPTDAICAGTPGSVVAPAITSGAIQADLDVAAVLDNGGAPIAWGDLAHHGAEVLVWLASVEMGYLYLPAGPRESFTPETAAGFVGPGVTMMANASLGELDAFSASGVTFPDLKDVAIFSPDHPGGLGGLVGSASPFKLPALQGWLRAGHLGVDGELATYYALHDERLGNPDRKGYVGVDPFHANLFVNDKRNLLAQFITSATYDSNFGGTFAIPDPCGIDPLEFSKMQLTSTAHLVGGDVSLPYPGGVKLAHWQLDLVPTGQPTQAGVVSARTGRIVFLAAGIAEKIHFDMPFGLTWGEMLANGDLGDLFLDFNNWGQRFDGLTYNPRAIALADPHASPSIPDPYLATSGTIVFPFFGVHPLNIRDAIGSKAASPSFGRNVTVPKAALRAGWPATDIALNGTWKNITSNDVAVVACQDPQVDYNTASQNGFIGTGTADIDFFHSDPLTAVVDIHDNATDIRMTSTDTHDLDIGLLARIGGMSEIAGCARIEGPLLTRMSFYGLLEQSVAAGSLLGPKAGYVVDIDINVTPTSFDFYASGDFLLAIGPTEVEASASVHFLQDFATYSAEGEVIGRINCDQVVSGLAGEGQLTWHADPGMQYLQGRVKVTAFSWTAQGGLEGGFFLGESVPSNLVWVLQPTNVHFGVSAMLFPPTLTGVFAYGQISYGVNWYVFGGGVDLYLAMGAFATIPAGGVTAVVGLGLPYVVGACGVYVHGEILGGLVSASAWANLALLGPVPLRFEGTIGLEGCVAWVLCASVQLDAGLNNDGFFLHK
jgi:hypothetical protein